MKRLKCAQGVVFTRVMRILNHCGRRIIGFLPKLNSVCTGHCGFTLSELLLSLTIVGVIATLTVPVLINNFQKRMFATQVKDFVSEIERLAQDELMEHNTRDLLNTDFESSQKLLTDKHFAIAKTCAADKSDRDCWKMTATGKDKITYRKLDKTSYPYNFNCGITIVLKNGAMLCYGFINGYPRIIVDINGNEKPNIIGRDSLAFYLNSKGQAVDYSYIKKQNDTLATKINNCKSATTQIGQWCFGALKDNNWKMDY